MKKTLLAVLVALFLSPAAFADNWGAAFKLGFGDNDPKTLKNTFNEPVTTKDLNEGDEVFGLEALYEKNLTQKDKIGLRVGIDFYGENELKTSYSYDVGFGTMETAHEKATETSYAFPLTLYYKRDNGIKNWSFFAGAGITYINSELELTHDDTENDHDELSLSKNKVFPHLMAGIEYRFSELFALGVEAKYNFSAKAEKTYGGSKIVVSDRSGFNGALSARFYF